MSDTIGVPRSVGKPLKWHGGKYYQAKWLHSLAPPSYQQDKTSGYTHRNIVFFGGGQEFWNWEPIEGISEAVNDTNQCLVTFFCALQCPAIFNAFMHQLTFTPFAEEEWLLAWKAQQDKPFPEWYDKDKLRRAADFFVRYRQSRQGLGECFATPTTRIRGGMNENVSAWLSAIDGLPACHKRLQRVEIRNMSFEKFIPMYDHKRALFYCDPTYLPETRASVGEYKEHEMTPEQHEQLLGLLAGIEGKFMLSGYPSNMYMDWQTKHGFRRNELEIDNKASSAKVKPKKIECVWTNY